MRGGEGHEFGDEGDCVASLCRDVVCDIAGEPYECSGGDEALLSMWDVQGLGNGVRRIKHGSGGCPVHFTLWRGGLRLMLAPA